jgi:hypothetical protein
MPEEIYPGAYWNPGRNAGFASGSSSMQAVICHYTVGKNSTGIGLDGYFHWLIGRDGGIQQFSECSSITWHAGEANGVGPGIEVEFLDEEEGVFTDAARNTCAGLIHWLAGEWGVPLNYYESPERIPPHTMHGFVAHRSVQQTDGHTDYWPWQDWERMIEMGGGVVLPPPVQPGPAPGPSPGAPPWPGTLLSDFTVGGGTIQWQQQMAHRGWNIDVDDLYGPASAQVCRQFQAEKGLDVDGVVGPITWDAAWSFPIT